MELLKLLAAVFVACLIVVGAGVSARFKEALRRELGEQRQG